MSRIDFGLVESRINGTTLSIKIMISRIASKSDVSAFVLIVHAEFEL